MCVAGTPSLELCLTRFYSDAECQDSLRSPSPSQVCSCWSKQSIHRITSIWAEGASCAGIPMVQLWTLHWMQACMNAYSASPWWAALPFCMQLGACIEHVSAHADSGTVGFAAAEE